MKRKIFVFLLFVSIVSTAQVKLDTITVKQVAAGVYHYYVQEKSVPWNLNFLKVDLRNSNIKIKTVKAEDKLIARETTSSMAKRNSNDSNLVVGAINADFFDGVGIPIGAQVSDGQLVSSSVAPSWTKIGFDVSNNPMIGRINFSGKVITKNQTNILNAVNQQRSENFLVLYNSFNGTSTQTNEWGTEIEIEPVTSWIINDTVKAIVKNKITNIGNMTIPQGNAVLSGHGTAKDFLNTFVDVGDTIKLVINLQPGLEKLWQMVSGFPVILKNGVNYALKGYAEEGGSASFATDRHPRTAAGISADSNYLFLVVVDGRQTISRGMSLPELADFFIKIGAYNAVNLDGGGSSTILIRDKIVNYPSDGTERKVSNCLLVSTSEKMNLSELKIFPDSVTTDLNRKINFSISAKDIYGYNKVLNFKDINFELTNTDIGSISSDGVFNPQSTGETFLLINFGSMSDTAKISVQQGVGVNLLEGFEDISDIEMIGKEIDTANSNIEISKDYFSEGSSSIKINYSYTYQTGKTYWIYLNKPFQIFGIPDKIVIDAMSDGWNHKIAFVATDENGEEFAFLTNTYANQTQHFDSVYALLSNPIKILPSSVFFFPIAIKQIAITLGNDRQNGKTYSGTIYLDNLRIMYPEITSKDESVVFTNTFFLEQNYPNPFNPETTIKFTIPNEFKNFNNTTNVTLKIFDVLGKEIQILIDEKKTAGTYEVKFNASNFASGVYFYKLTADNFSATKKLIFLK